MVIFNLTPSQHIIPHKRHNVRTIKFRFKILTSILFNTANGVLSPSIQGPSETQMQTTVTSSVESYRIPHSGVQENDTVPDLLNRLQCAIAREREVNITGTTSAPPQYSSLPDISIGGMSPVVEKARAASAS